MEKENLWRNRTTLAPKEYKRRLERLRRTIRSKLQRDRRLRISKIAEAMHQLLEEGKMIEAWDQIRWWYRDFTGHLFPPSPSELKARSAEFETLYTAPLHIPAMPYEMRIHNEWEINSSCPLESEIVQNINKLKNKGGISPSGLSIPILKLWAKNNQSSPQHT